MEYILSVYNMESTIPNLWLLKNLDQAEIMTLVNYYKYFMPLLYFERNKNKKNTLIELGNVILKI